MRSMFAAADDSTRILANLSVEVYQSRYIRLFVLECVGIKLRSDLYEFLAEVPSAFPTAKNEKASKRPCYEIGNNLDRHPNIAEKTDDEAR